MLIRLYLVFTTRKRSIMWDARMGIPAADKNLAYEVKVNYLVEEVAKLKQEIAELKNRIA